MLKKLFTLPLTLTRAGLARSAIFSVASLCQTNTMISQMQRSFASKPPPTPPPQTPPPPPPTPKGTQIDQFLAKIVSDLEQKQRDKVIMNPTEYFHHLETVLRLIEDPRAEGITQESSLSALIYLCVMTAQNLPKLKPIEIVRAVQHLHNLSMELGFKFPKTHMDKIIQAIPEPFPKELKKVYPFFLKLIARIADIQSLDSLKNILGPKTDKFVKESKDELKAQDIGAIFDIWLSTGYRNEETLKLMKEHILKYWKIMTFTPADIHVIFYYEATQVKEHTKEFVNFLVEKTKEHIPAMDIYLLINILIFKKSLDINDIDLQKTLLNAIRLALQTDRQVLMPVAYTQLLGALVEYPEEEARDILDKVIEMFMNEKKGLQNPDAWNALATYMLIVGSDKAKTSVKDFFPKVEALLTKTILRVSPEFIEVTEKALKNSRFVKSRGIMDNFAEAKKRIKERAAKPNPPKPEKK